MVLSPVIDFVRRSLLRFLFFLVAYLTGRRLSVDFVEDTARLSDSRKSLEVPFVFQGRRHTISLPYNPYRIESSDVKVFDLEDNLLDIHYTTCPGLQDHLFHLEALNHIYSGKVGKIVVEDPGDD